METLALILASLLACIGLTAYIDGISCGEPSHKKIGTVMILSSAVLMLVTVIILIAVH